MTAGLVALAAVTTACNKTSGGSGDDRVAVRFSAKTATRASGDTWTAGDRIGIRMLDGTQATSGGYANKEYSAASAGALVNFTAAGGENMFYPADGSTVNFASYYPYTASLSGNTYSVNIATQSSPAAIDLLWAKTTAGYDKDDTQAVQLEFGHMLSKFILEPTAHASVGASLEGMTVTIKGLSTTASFDIVSGSVSGEGGTSDIVPYTVTDGSRYEAIVLPAAITAGNVTVEFTVDSKAFIWNMPAADFLKGKEHLWEITITGSGVAGIEASIKDWEPGTGGTGTAE